MSKKIPDKIPGHTATKDGSLQKYVLRLFVSGSLPDSINAIANIKVICEKYLKNRHELEIIDIYRQPSMALTEDIVAIPVLVKKLPLPQEIMIGDLSDTQSVLKVLHLGHFNV